MLSIQGFIKVNEGLINTADPKELFHLPDGGWYIRMYLLETTIGLVFWWFLRATSEPQHRWLRHPGASHLCYHNWIKLSIEGIMGLHTVYTCRQDAGFVYRVQKYSLSAFSWENICRPLASLQLKWTISFSNRTPRKGHSDFEIMAAFTYKRDRMWILKVLVCVFQTITFVHYPENLLQLWLQDFSPLMTRKEDVPWKNIWDK